MEQRFDVIDDPAIAELVVDFYTRARHDPLLGPVFLEAIGTTDEAWAEHLRRIADFWSSVLLATRRYQGRPMVVHAALPRIGPDHFARWLALFEQTARDRFTPGAADRFIEASQRIGRSFQAGLAMVRGEG